MMSVTRNVNSEGEIRGWGKKIKIDNPEVVDSKQIFFLFFLKYIINKKRLSIIKRDRK